MGSHTYEAAAARLGKASLQSKEVVVVSRTLQPADHPDIAIISNLTSDSIKSLRTRSRKDIWLVGGGTLFGALLGMKEVDPLK